MANLFSNLPVPAGNGSGAGVDVSQLGRLRTITVLGTFAGTLTVEGSGESINGPWAPIISFQNVSDERRINIAAPFMRVTRSGVPGLGPAGLPNVDVGSNDNGCMFADVPVPPASGVGAAVDTSNFGTFKTIYCLGAFTGAVSIELSEDGVDWATITTFTTPGQRSFEFTSMFVRVSRAGTAAVPGLPDVSIAAVNDPVSSFADGAGTTLIYKPGSGEAGPVVYANWADLYARLQVLRANANGSGLYYICFDASLVSPCVVPAGIYDMLGCIWRGFGKGPSDSVSLADGVVLQNLYEYQNNLTVVAVATTTPPVVCATGDTYQLNGGATVSASGAAGYFSGAALVAGQFCTFRLSTVSSIGNALVDSINFPVAGTFCFLSLGDQCGVQNNALDIAAGATLQVFYRSTSAGINPTQPAMLGTLIVTDLVVDRWRTRAITGAAVAAAFGDQIGYTPPGAGGTVTLPTITAFSAGLPICIKRLNAANALTITPAGGQTIEGAASLSLTGLQSVILCPDGPVPAGTNWRIIAMFNDAIGFGMNFQSALAAGRTTTTLATFQTKTTLVTPALTGTYRVMATANIDSILSMQVRLQNVTDGVQLGDTGEYSPLTSGDSIAWVACGDVVFAGVAKTFEVQWRDTPPGGQTAGISDARIEFWRVA